MPLNIELAEKTLQYMKTSRFFKMSDWIVSIDRTFKELLPGQEPGPECGATLCAAGAAVHFAGYKIYFQPEEEGVPDRRYSKKWCEKLDEPGVEYDIENTAYQALVPGGDADLVSELYSIFYRTDGGYWYNSDWCDGDFNSYNNEYIEPEEWAIRSFEALINREKAYQESLNDTR